MGNSSSTNKDDKAARFFENAKKKFKAGVDQEISHRMMIQREVQMAVNIAKARDNIHIFGSLWLTLTTGVVAAHLAKVSVPKSVGLPIVIGGVVLGNMADFAYGNKLARVNREAEYILEHERARFVPFPQAPFARFYSSEERAMLYDKATAVGDLAPFSLISRSFAPKKND
eukprot:scaffold6886_cov106-Cylindrotheca_fusiformis.AAC.4